MKINKKLKQFKPIIILMSVPLLAGVIGIVAMKISVENIVLTTEEEDREFDLALSSLLEVGKKIDSNLNLKQIDNDKFFPEYTNLEVKAQKLGQYYCGRLKQGMDTAELYKELSSKSQKAEAIAVHVLIVQASEDSYCSGYSLSKRDTSIISKYNSDNSLYDKDSDYRLCMDTIIEGGGSRSEGTENCRKFKEKYDPSW